MSEKSTVTGKSPKYEKPMPRYDLYVEPIETIFAIAVTAGSFGEEWLPESFQRVPVVLRAMPSFISDKQSVILERKIEVPPANLANGDEDVFEPTSHAVIFDKPDEGPVIVSLSDGALSMVDTKNKGITAQRPLSSDEVIELIDLLGTARPILN